LIQEAGDSDWITVDLPSANGTPILIRGSANEEGSDLDTTIRLWTTDGSLLLEQDLLGTESYAFYPSASDESVVLEVTDGNAGGSEEHWGYVYFAVYDSPYSTTISEVDYEVPQETEPNDAQDTAQYLSHTEFATDGGSAYTGAFVWGDLGTSVDEDWYQVTATQDSYLQVYTSASDWGSGADPMIEVYAVDGELIGTYNDGSDGGTGPDFEDVGPFDAGMVYLRVIDEQMLPEGGEQDFYRLSIYFTSWKNGK
jgi:hypothetical protein